MVTAFVDHLGVSAEAVMMVGDNTHDLEAGRAAGARTVGVLTGDTDHDTLSPLADYILPSVTALPDLLQDIGLKNDGLLDRVLVSGHIGDNWVGLGPDRFSGNDCNIDGFRSFGSNILVDGPDLFAVNPDFADTQTPSTSGCKAYTVLCPDRFFGNSLSACPDILCGQGIACWYSCDVLPYSDDDPFGFLPLRFEQATIRRLIGISLGFAAVVLLVQPGTDARSTSDLFWIGVALIVSVSYTLRTYISVRRPEALHPLTALWGMNAVAVGLLFLAMIAMGIEFRVEIGLARQRLRSWRCRSSISGAMPV